MSRNRRRESARPPRDRQSARLRRAVGRFGRPAWRLVRSIGLVAIAIAVGHNASRYAAKSPYFNIRNVKIQSISHFSEDEIRGQLGLDDEVNVFEFDSIAAEEVLLSHPWVSEAYVRKFLPDRVVVELQERVPAAVVSMDGLYFVDETGRPFVRPTPQEITGHSILTGLNRTDFEQDPELTHKKVRDALALLRAYQQRKLLSNDYASSIHIKWDGGIEIILGRTRVDFGQTGYEEKLERLDMVLHRLESRRRDAAYILLDDTGNRAIVREVPRRENAEHALLIR